METVLRAAALCLVGCVLTQLLKREVPALGLLLTLALAMVLAMPVLRAAEGVSALLTEFSTLCGIGKGELAIVLKCAVMAAVVRLGGELCRDAGQSALASLLELTGTVAATAMALPLFRAVWETILTL